MPPGSPGMARGLIPVLGEREALVGLARRARREALRQVRRKPRLAEPADALQPVRQVQIEQDDDRRLILLGELERASGAAIATLDVGRREHDALGVARAAVDREIEVRLLGLGRHAGRRAAALRHEDHHGHFRHHAEPEHLGHQRQARPRGGGRRARAGIARADRGRDRRDLVLGLEHPPALPGQARRQHLEDRGRRRDRIAEEGLDAGIQAAMDDRGVAAHHHGVAAALGRRAELDEVELERRLALRVAGIERLDVALGDRGRLALELARDGLVERRRAASRTARPDSRAPPCCAIWRRRSRARTARASAGRRAAGPA